MAKRFNRDSNSENTKLRNIMDNPQNENIMRDIFEILQAAHPDKQGEDILTAAENAINEGSGTGLLQALNSRNALDFGFFGHESFSIDELGLLNLNKIPGLDVSDDMRASIENAIVHCIKHEFSHGLEHEVAQKFNETVRFHNTTLAELLTSINLFEKQLNGEDKGKYLKFKNNFVLTFLQIKNNLAPINDSSNNNINDNLNTKSFSDWTESQQKAFDYLFSKLILSRLHSRVEQIGLIAGNITNSFSLPLSLSSIPQSQQFSLGEKGYESLKEYARDNLPELFEQLTNATEEQLEEIYWAIYLNKIEATDPALAEAVDYLYEHNFDFSCLNTDIAKRDAFLSKLAELRLQEMEKSGAIEAFGNDTEQFKQFFRDLFDFGKKEINVNGVTLQIEKELKSGGEVLELKDLTEFMNAKNLPIKFSIKGVDNLNLSMDDQNVFNKLFQEDFVETTETNEDGTLGEKHKEVVLEDSKVGKLLILYLMGNPGVLDSYDPNSESAKKLDKFFKSIDKEINIDKSKRNLNEEERHLDEDEEQRPENIEQGEVSEKDRILAKWNSIKGDETPEGQDSFGEGAILYWPFGMSIVPPKNEVAKDWMKLYIKDVNWARGTVIFRSNGVELPLPGKYENEEIEMPISLFEERFLNDKPKIGGEAFKILSSENDFEKAFQKYSAEKLCPESLFGDAHFEDGKLMIRNRGMDGKEYNEEVKYFGTGLNVPDDSKVVYKVDWNKDGTVTVKSSSFLSDGKPYEYKRKMSYPDFLIFISEKNLSPRTERMAEEEQTKIKDIVSHRTTKWKWISIGGLMYSFKNIWKTLSDGIDSYQKKQNEECLNWLVTKGIYDKIGKWFGWASPALADAAMNAQDKAEKGMDKGIWEGIDAWLKEFSSMADFANYFANGEDWPSGQKLRQLNKILQDRGFKTLKDVVSSGSFVGEDDKLRPVIAAAMIANIKKGAGLYRGIAEQDNQCLWIRCLFGPDHYRRYLEMRKKLENNIRIAETSGDSGKAKQLSDLLVQSETMYIINCIENSHGKDEYFGAPSDNNAQALKLMYSNEFASQLSSAVEEGVGEGAIDKGYSGMKKFNLFDPVFKEVEKNITSGRIDRGLGNIERLGEVAVNNSDFVNLNIAMTYVTLTGILNRKESKTVRTRFDGLARAYMLPTAFFGEKNENQRNAWYILDKCGCDFTGFMKSKGLSMEQFLATSDNIPYKQLFGALKEWWTKNATQIDAYFESLKTNEQTDPILKKVSKILWEQNPDSISPKWRGKPKITGHYALLASPESIRQNKGYDKGGFSGETDERNDKAAFWSSLKDSLNRAKTNNAKPKFFLNEFKLLFNYEGFGTGNDAENNRMIQMIQEVKKRGESRELITFQIPDSGKVYHVPTNASYGPNDYKNLIWYMFKGRVLSRGNSVPPKELDDVLEFFVDYFTENFNKIAGDKALLQDVFPVREELPIRKLVPWNEYQDITWGDSNYGDLLAIGDEGDIDSDDKETRNKGLKRLKKKHYKQSSEFYNVEFVDIQKTLKRIGVPATTLSNVAGATGVTFA